MDEWKGLQYRGYGRYLCIIAAGADADAFLPILQACRKRKYRVFCDPAAKPLHLRDKLDAASAVIVFVSAQMIGDAACMDAVSYASCLGKPLISVYLDATALPGGLAMLLNSRQALLLSDYPDMDTFYEKLFSAKTIANMRASKIQLLRRFRVVGGTVQALCFAAVLLVLLAVLIVTRLLSPFEKKPVAVAEAAGPQATQSAASSEETARNTPILPGTPLTIEELDTIQGVWIIGGQFVAYDGSFDDMMQSGTIRKGNIGDLSDLSQFPNLTSVRLYRQSGTVDLTPLFACERLRRIYLNDVSVASFAGIENLRQLSVLSIVNCGSVDLSSLADCDFSYAEKESGGFRLSITETALQDCAVLGKVRRYKLLSTDIAVTTLAPALADCKEIDELICTNVGSMAAFGELPCVKMLTVQDSRVTSLAGMEGLSNLETLSISDNLRSIGDVGEMPKLTKIISGASATQSIRVNPISSIDGLIEAFPNLREANFPRLTETEQSKLEDFLIGNRR